MKSQSQKIKELQEAGYEIVHEPKVKHPNTNELVSIDEAYNKAFNQIDYFTTMDVIRNASVGAK